MRGTICGLAAIALVSSLTAAELFSNGTYVTGTNSNGDTISQALPYGTGPDSGTNSVAGFNFDKAEGMAAADNFTIPAGQTWDLQTLKLYAYQTLAPNDTSTTPTLTAAFVRIYSGDPRSGGVLVAGDTTTNRLVGGSFTGVYRVFNGTSDPSHLLNKRRPVMEYSVDMSWVPDLPSGTYYVAVTSTGSLDSGPWWVPITDLTANNAALEDTSVWMNLMEEELVNGASQNPVVERPRDLMFKLDGNILAIKINPNNITWGPGLPVSGGLASLFTSDDDRYVFRPTAVAISTARPVVLVMEGTAPGASASQLQFVIESSGSVPNLNETIEFYNFSTTSYDAPLGAIIGTTDGVRTLTLSNPNNYIGPGNMVRVRVGYKPTTPVALFPWNARLDEATWRFTF